MQLLHSVVAMVWCIRASHCLEGLTNLKTFTEFRNLVEFPEDVQLADEPDWMIEFEVDMPILEYTSFCTPLEGHVCSSITQDAVDKLVRFRGSFEALYYVCRSYLRWVRVITPDYEFHLAPYDLQDVSAAFLQRNSLWGLERVHPNRRENTGSGVNMFILDTGVRTSHDDFGGRGISTLDLTTGGVVECNGATSCAADRQGHGTHCAGIAAGSAYGVAPGSTIRSVRC